jgi:large subunit ribosomal protein L13
MLSSGEKAPMKAKLQKTFTPKPADITREWFVVDATDQTLGRLASDVAHLLRGKHKPTYAPHVDGGDFVVIVNAEKVAVTGNKALQKRYFRHSGYPGGLREFSFEDMRERFPERIIEGAVKGMLPKNKLGRKMLAKLKVYAGPEHPHGAQKPQPIEIGKKVDL